MNIAGLVQGISMLLWVVVIGVVALVATAAWRNKPIKNGRFIVIISLIGAVIITTLSFGLVFINPDTRGVVTSALTPQGYRSEPLGPGLHFIVPFAETVQLYSISRQTYTMSVAPKEGQVSGDDSISARTSDGQEVFIDASVIYTIDPAKVIQVHIQWQNRYSDELVRPLARGIIRDLVSQYKVEEVVTSKRAEIIASISSQMQAKLEENGLTLIDFVLRNIAFTDQYSQSVEQKQIAEQLAQQAAYVVQQRQQEAEQARQVAKGLADSAVIKAQGDAQARIIQAQAEAEALTTIAKALEGHPELLTYQYITKLSPNVQIMYLPSGTPFILPSTAITTPQ